MTAPKYVVVPVIATNDMKREACFVELFSDMSEAASDLTWEEAGEIYSAMIQMAPDTGMVAVRRELLHKMWKTLEKTDSFNSFSAEEEQEMIESLCGDP